MVLDVNILLYAHVEGSPFHAACRDWLEAAVGGSRVVGLPLVTALGFVRILTNPRAVDPPVPTSTAMRALEVLRSAPAVEDVAPAAGHWERVSSAAEVVQATGPALTDVHLAVLAMERGATLITHDAGFRRFEGLKTHDPAQAAAT